MSDLFFGSLDDLIAVASEGAVHPALVWQRVVGEPPVELADGQHKVLFALEEP